MSNHTPQSELTNLSPLTQIVDPSADTLDADTNPPQPAVAPEAAMELIPVEIADDVAHAASFAPFAPAESSMLPLSSAQRTALERLTAGHSMADSAAAAGVNRTTLYRWLHHDAEFTAAYNAWQHDAIATTRAHLLALVSTAVTTLHGALRRGDGNLAFKLLREMGFASPLTPGSGDAASINVEQRQECEKAEQRLFLQSLAAKYGTSVQTNPDGSEKIIRRGPVQTLNAAIKAEL